jgi:hypothetical protein
MDTFSVFLIFFISFSVWNVITSMLIYGTLQEYVIKLNLISFRLLLPKFVCKYKDITKSTRGKVGLLFYHWIISINLALITFIIYGISTGF